MINDIHQQSLRWQAGAISDSGFAASYFLLWLMHNHGLRFASRIHRGSLQPDPRRWREQLLSASGDTLDDLLIDHLEQYRFFRIIPSVPIALCHWLRGDWPLTLLTHIPSARQVLEMQVDGIRPVTVFSQFPRASCPILTKANGFEFLVHDLEHAWKFCHDPARYWAQQSFFSCLQTLVFSGVLDPHLLDPEFSAKFDYLISDMNTHPVHGLRYFHAVLVESLLRREGLGPRETLPETARLEILQLLQRLADLWDFNGQQTQALMALAGQQFSKTDAMILEQYFIQALPRDTQ